MPFRPQDLHDFATAQEIRVQTRRQDGAIRSTVIWVVVDNDQIFVRSVNGGGGIWYQEALDSGQATLDDQGRHLETKVIPVHDADSITRVTEALKHKYAGVPGLDEMIRPPALDATFRLDPLYDGEGALEAPAYLGSDEESELGPPVEIGMLDSGGPISEDVILQPQKPA